jgi:hypothetical protein
MKKSERNWRKNYVVMKNICVVICCFLMVSCGTQRATVATHTIKADTVFLYKNTVSSHVDTLTVQMFDTVRVTQHGDTLIIEKILDRIIYRNKIKTDTLCVRDTVIRHTQSIDNKEVIKETINLKVTFFLAVAIAAIFLFFYFKFKK